MAGSGSKGARQVTRAEAERSRLYVARGQWHAAQKRRRVVDNTIAGVAGGLLLVGIVVSQSVHAQVTAPEPTPAPVSTPAPVETTTPTPEPSATPTSTPTP